MVFGFDSNRPSSLRGQLIGLVAALAIPLIALQVWWGYRESQRAQEAAVATALSLADATALSVRQFLAQSEAILMAASALYGETFVSGTPCDNEMSTLLDLFPFLASVTTVDRDGRRMCSARPLTEGTSASNGEPF